MATFRKLKSGKTQVVVRKKNYPNISKSFLTATSAKRWARMIETQMENRVFEDLSGAEGTTLKDLLIKYRDEVVPTLKSKTTLTYKINYTLKFKVCYYNLLELNTSHINIFKKEISVGRAPKTINAYINTLKHVWELARTQWGISLPPQSPFALVPMEKVNNTRDITLTDEEFKKLVEEADKIDIRDKSQNVIGKANWLPDLIIFAAATAGRYSEIINLKRSDVDFNKRTAIFKDTKNGEDRSIPLSHEAIRILKKQPFGEKFFNIKSRDQFKNYFNRARKNAGLPEFRFHDLRSHAIRKMLLSGMQTIEVARISGHKTLAVLHRRYSRLQPEDLIEKVDNVVLIKR